MDRNYNVITFIAKYLYFRVAICADIKKIIIIFIKRIFKDQKKLKELEITYQNAVYICIF